jgi:eukaryotic-like serine/threonine-protein kinase
VASGTSSVTAQRAGSLPEADEGPRSLVGEASSRPLVATIGQVLAGKYRVIRLIGQGGMGLVVEAHHEKLDRRVALKLLSPRAREDGEAVERFLREAKAAAKIRSEHVGRVVDVDALEGGEPFIVMELLEGRDLAEELAAEGTLGVERAVTLVLQACEAIAEAHAAGIVHRDLKPANLFLARDASGKVSVKVLDFGISKITLAESPDRSQAKALTSASAMLGSPLYMSPEQMRASGDVDKRTDIWSLGVMLYEMVVGKSPFDSSSIPMVCANVLSIPMPPTGRDDLPEGFEKMLLRCLEKEPEARYRDIYHFARALSRFAPAQAEISIDYISSLKTPAGEPASLPSLSLLPPPPEAAATSTAWDEHGARAPRRRRWPLVAAAAALVIAGGALFSFAATRPTDTPRGAAVGPAELGRAGDGEPSVSRGEGATPAESAAPAPRPEVVASAEPEAASSAEPLAAPTAETSGASASPPGTASLAPPPARPRRPAPASTGPKRTAGFGERD